MIGRPGSPQIVSPVRLEIAGDGLRATLTVTLDGEATFPVAARLLADGRPHDLQAHGPAWRAGTTGDPDLDREVLQAVEAAFVAAHNALAVVELDRRGRRTGPRPRR